MSSPNWLEVWRKGFAPQISTEALIGLRDAWERDDPRILQGKTTTPLRYVQDWPVEGACSTAYCAAVSNGGFAINDDGSVNKNAATVAECEEFFGRVCFKCDQIMGEPAACAFYLNFHDESPREEVRQSMIAELNDELQRRLAAI